MVKSGSVFGSRASISSLVWQEIKPECTSTTNKVCLSPSKVTSNHPQCCTSATMGPDKVGVGEVARSPVSLAALERCFCELLLWDSLGRVTGASVYEITASLVSFLSADTGSGLSGLGAGAGAGVVAKELSHAVALGVGTGLGFRPNRTSISLCMPAWCSLYSSAPKAAMHPLSTASNEAGAGSFLSEKHALVGIWEAISST